MKHRIPNSRIICCASVFALSLTACSHNGKLKNDANLTDNRANESTGQYVKLKKGHRTNRLSGKFPDPRSYDNLWDRLFDRFDLPEENNADIDRELSWFIGHPSYIDRVQSRAEPFLYSIVKQLEKNNMPGELALLPVIESAFKPHAVSPAHAAGIWQFIPATGKHYGLKSSFSYDGRRDIYASTKAAIKYLKKLHNDFNGDWLLAIAGYNCGEGAVARAIQKNNARGLPTDFWSLDLPQETRSYVPRLLAVARLFSQAEQYNIALQPIPNKALYKTVVLKDQVDLALAASAAEISLDKLFELNPGFKRQRVDVNGSYRLFIPAHKKTVEFKQELARQVAAQGYTDQSASPSADEYTPGRSTGVESDMTSPSPSTAPRFEQPAPIPEEPPSDFGAKAPAQAAEPIFASNAPAPATRIQPEETQVPVETTVTPPDPRSSPEEGVVEANPSIGEPLPVPKFETARAIGQRRVPESMRLAEIYANETPHESDLSVASYERIATATRVRQVPKSTPKIVRTPPDEQPVKELTVKKLPDKERAKPVERETLASIQHDERNLVRVGNRSMMKNRDETAVERRPPELENAPRKAAYVVKEGDTLHSIARKHDMEVDDLKKLNRVTDADDIKWGQSMKVVAREVNEKPPLPKTASAVKASPSSSKYTAHDGETVFSISKRFNVTVADLRKWNGNKIDNKPFKQGTNLHVSGVKN